MKGTMLIKGLYHFIFFVEKCTIIVVKIPSTKWVEICGKEGRFGRNSVLGFYSVNYFLDGITLITKDEASGSSVTAEEAKKVLITLCL